MPEDFEFLNQDDVINLYEKESLRFGRIKMLDTSSTFRVEELRDKVEQNNVAGLRDTVFDCRVLHHNQIGWRSGKMQVIIEVKFMPDEPIKEESLTEENEFHEEDNPLEELRNLRGIENP